MTAVSEELDTMSFLLLGFIIFSFMSFPIWVAEHNIYSGYTQIFHE